MAVNLTLTLTLNGRDALWNSRSTGVKLDITHLQFGVRNRLTTGEESFLNQPKQYTQIQNGSKIGPDQVRIMATMPGVENYNVAEIGLWSGEPGLVGSILIAYVSVATGFIAQMVLGIDLVFTYDMVISTVDIDYVNIIKDTDQSSTFALLADHEVDRNAHPYYLTTDTEQTVSGTKTFTSKAIFSSGLSGELDGNAASATKLATERTISFSGAATGSFNFDGSSNSSALLTLANSGVAASTYGGGLKVPVFTVNAKGLITGVSEQNIPIVDNLTTEDATKPVSAKQAKSLQDNKLDKDANAASATKLQTGRKINKVEFDGSKDIEIGDPIGLFLGGVQWFNGSRAKVPDGYLTADGQLLSRNTFPDLWSAINASFEPIADEVWLAGSGKRASFSKGDGTTTFRMPDLNGVQVGSLRGLFLRGDGNGIIANRSVLSGTVLSDAIRNIIGSIGSLRTGTTYPPLTGPFYLDGNTSTSITGATGTIYQSIGFDASITVPTAEENRPVSAVGVWIIRAIGKTMPQPASGSPATLLANTFNGSQEISGNLTLSGKLTLGNSDIQVVTGTNYTITYDYSTRLAHIQMRIFTNTRIYLGLPYSNNQETGYLKDITLPITLKKRLFTEVFFSPGDNPSVGPMAEAYEWLWWTPPPGIDGTTDSKVRISARRLSGTTDEFCNCDLYVTGYF